MVVDLIQRVLTYTYPQRRQRGLLQERLTEQSTRTARRLFSKTNWGLKRTPQAVEALTQKTVLLLSLNCVTFIGQPFLAGTENVLYQNPAVSQHKLR